MPKIPLNIVVLKRVRYSDRHAILTAWSRERGRVSLLVADGTGRAAARVRALTAPPGILECIADLRPGRDIHSAGQFRPIHPLGDVRANPVKEMVAMFLAEVMGAVMRESQPDESAFDFIVLALRALDTLDDSNAIANFHLWFLYQLGRILGVEPDVTTWRRGRVLDMLDGLYRPTLPPHPNYLDPAESAFAARMARLSLANMKKWRMTRTERNRALDVILRYLALHLAPGLTRMQSLEVLRELL